MKVTGERTNCAIYMKVSSMEQSKQVGDTSIPNQVDQVRNMEKSKITPRPWLASADDAKRLLGGLIVQPHAIDYVANMLEPDDLLHLGNDYKAIYETLLALRMLGKVINATQVIHELGAEVEIDIEELTSWGEDINRSDLEVIARNIRHDAFLVDFFVNSRTFPKMR